MGLVDIGVFKGLRSLRASAAKFKCSPQGVDDNLMFAQTGGLVFADPGSSLVDHAWTCRCCGRQFNTLPLDVAYKGPDHWFDIPESEQQVRRKLDDDLCVIDKDMFVRGCLEIPVIGRDDRFVWGLWVSVSEESFMRILELWNASAVEQEPPKFGWLCNNISLYPSTMSLKTNLRLRSGGARPSIELEPTDHPLAIEQRHGISIERVEEIAAALSLRH